MRDILKSFLSFSQWWTLAWFDIRQSYRRSVLGPIWITLNTGILVVALSLLWINVFKVELHELLPFFAIGNVLWVFISTQINEACTGFSQFSGYIHQLNLPLPIYPLRIWARNIIFLLHNFLIVLFVWIYFGMDWVPNFGEMVLGFCLLMPTIYFIAFPIAYLCARYRDIPLIVQNGIQLMFFMTPIFWKPGMLPVDKAWVTGLNPFYHLIEVVRKPLLGESVPLETWVWVVSLLVVFMLISILVHKKYKKMVAYWL